jgi:hypothetical protein
MNYGQTEGRCTIGQANNQVPKVKPTQDHKHVNAMFQRAFNRIVVNSYLCKWLVKKACKWRYDWNIRFSKGGLGDLIMDNME